LSPADVDALTAYLATIDFRHQRARTLDPRVFRGAYAFYDAGCLACHRLGSEGTGDDRLSAPTRPRGDTLVRYLTVDEKHRSLMNKPVATEAADRIAAFLDDGTRPN
jgi:hypothetical protein